MVAAGAVDRYRKDDVLYNCVEKNLVEDCTSETQKAKELRKVCREFPNW